MSARTITDDFIEREKDFLSRDDGIQLTGIERPNIISAKRQTSEPTVAVIPTNQKQTNPVLKTILDNVDNHVKNLAGGIEASVRRLDGAVENGSKTTSNISTASSVAFPDTSQPIAKRVTFSPFKFRIWSKGDRDSGPNGGKSTLPTKTIPVGTYIFTLKTPIAFPDIAEIDTAIPFKVSGKHAVLEKVAYDKETATMKVQVRLVQNSFVLATLAVTLALGAGGYLVSSGNDFVNSSLEGIDRVLDTTIVGSVVLGSGYFILKKMRYI